MWMKLLEALKIANLAKQRTHPKFETTLVAGCSPLSLSTFLAAHLSQLHAERCFEVNEAGYGDILDSVRSAYGAGGDAIAIIMDYPSIDARLGLRRASSWTDEAVVDILQNAQARLDLLQAIIAGERNRRTVIHPPVLQLPPVAGGGSWQMSSLEASLEMLFARFRASVVDVPGVFFVRPEAEAIHRQRDVDGELTADFPYDQPTASAICEGLAKGLMPPVALKGIITDLDDTMWRELVGEVGAGGVHWNLDGKSQIHAVYQQLLAAAASRGILVAVASKNDQAVVEAAIAREDMLIKGEQIFPIIANWNPKSQAVEQILKRWNIGADAVVFVDDNPYELDEVRGAHPGISTLQFFPNDASQTYEQLTHLRDLCYRETRSEEDALRLASIRASAQLAQEAAGSTSMEDFLAGLGASIGFEQIVSLEDQRPFELLNKTNQFNLNGKRYTQSEWADALDRKDGICLAISYADKFGSLGRIGVLLGRRQDTEFVVDQWVLSCRSFSRRIEHATLRLLLDLFPGLPLRFNYKETPKNRPLLEMIGSYMGSEGEAVPAEHILSALPQVHAQVSGPELALQSAGDR
jgi:FkbH-like protein